MYAQQEQRRECKTNNLQWHQEIERGERREEEGESNTTKPHNEMKKKRLNLSLVLRSWVITRAVGNEETIALLNKHNLAVFNESM